MMNHDTWDLPVPIKTHLKTIRDIAIDGYCEKGQNGHVVFGFHAVLKQRVAIKYYYYGSGTHDEVQLVANIKNPNILSILEAHTIGDGYAYFITREMKLGDLDGLIESKGIGMREGITIIRGILNGVGELHRAPNNIVHRDLKPENILIDINKNPLIADFGSIKQIINGGDFVTGSKHAALYRPPEAYGESKYSYCSDIYQIGMILFQLMGGYLPYDPLEWMKQVQKKEFSKISNSFEQSQYVDEVIRARKVHGTLLDMNTLPLYVSAPIRAIINKATKADCSKRFQMAHEVLLSLHNLGSIPDWRIVRGQYHLINWKGKDYRIVPLRSGYICEKKSCATQQWRKDCGVQGGTANEALSLLINKLFP